MSIVPFAASVKVNPDTYAPNNVPTSSATWLDSSGTSPIHWSNVQNPTASGFTSRFDIFKKLKAASSSWTWGGCLEALPYPYNTQDVTPSSGTPETRYVPLFAPDEAGNYWFSLFGNTVQDKTNNNSYMDDGSGSGGTCDSNSTNTTTRFAQACKYNAIKNKMTRTARPELGLHLPRHHAPHERAVDADERDRPASGERPDQCRRRAALGLAHDHEDRRVHGGV
jgi:hypothetical protein